MNGNTGTNPATQFIGTSDSVDVVFKTNASEILRLKKNGKLNIAAFNGTTDRLIYTNSHGDVESFPITLPSPTNAVCNTNAYNYYSLLFQWDGITHVDLFNCWQRFGFGTTTPDDRIEVKGAIRVTNWLDPNDNDYIRISHDNGPSIVNHGAGNLSINADNGKSVNICTGTSGDVTLGGNNYLAPDAGKNVGIGTTNAQHKLEVAGDINATNFYRSGSLIGGLNSWQYLNSGSDLVYNNGKVGIGTGSSVPSYKLTVTHNDGNGGLALNRENSTAFKSQISFRQNDNEKWSLGIDKDEVGNNNFFIFGGNNPACRLLINQYGHVGIGTDEPGSFLLAVNGMIGARELKITAVDPFPDFVFENDYPL